MWNLGVVSWLYGKRCPLEKLIGYHIFFDIWCDIVAKNQVYKCENLWGFF